MSLRCPGANLGTAGAGPIRPVNLVEHLIELGTVVERRWRAAGHEIATFPAIAEAALLEFQAARRDPIDPSSDVAAVVQWLGGATELPKQNLTSRFSDFQLQVYSDDRFVVEVLFWTNGTTAIHQHDFAGAFFVLAGSSMHTLWRFELRERVSQALLVGELRETRVELLRVGDVRPIAPGDELIHSLFHLDRPSVTVVVRTHPIPAAHPQYQYLRSPSGSGLGVDSASRPPPLARKLKCLDMLIATASPSLESFIRDAIASEDAFGAGVLLQTLRLRVRDSARLDGVVRLARARHGAIVDHLIPAFAELERLQRIAAMRSKFTDPELRFFLAVLMNVTTRARALALVRERFPERDPAALVIGWVHRALAIEPLLAGQPLDRSALIALDMLLGGRSVAEIAATRSHDPAAIADRCRDLLRSPMLHVLFA